jgi:DNA-binding transcriptional LysR family regulator
MVQSKQLGLETIAESCSRDRCVEGFLNVRITLKEWRMLHAVVARGTFAKAAQLLHVSQPAISYTITKLEEQLGLPLLKLEGRKYKLTEAGNALLKHSRALLQQAVALEEFAKHLRQGWREQVRLAVDQDFPTSLVIPALHTFSSQCKDAKIHLREVHTSEIRKVLYDQSVDLAINSKIPPGFNGELLIKVEHVPVAHFEHPLFKLQRELTQADLDREVQVLTKSEIIAQINDRNGRPDITRYWQVSNLDTAESALCEGAGYGWLPKHRIHKSLESGKLKILPLLNGLRYKSNFYLVHGRPAIRSTEAERLAKVLHNVAAISTESIE